MSNTIKMFARLSVVILFIMVGLFAFKNMVSAGIYSYPAPICKDPYAANYNGPLPCQYPQVCQDPYAINQGQRPPCRYPELKCQDPYATNYGGWLPCKYPIPQKCQDPRAINYGGPLPCKYPNQTCEDPRAINFGSRPPCRYPDREEVRVDITGEDTSVEDGDGTRVHWETGGAHF